MVDPDACTACGDCLTACPYEAIAMAEEGGRHLAVISPTGCKGCGGCVPICPENAIDLLGYTDAQVTAMIDSLVEVPVDDEPERREIREIIREEPVMRGRILAVLAGRPADRAGDRHRHRRPTHEVVFWVMGMRRYGWLAEIKAARRRRLLQYEPTGRVS